MVFRPVGLGVSLVVAGTKSQLSCESTSEELEYMPALYPFEDLGSSSWENRSDISSGDELVVEKKY